MSANRTSLPRLASVEPAGSLRVRVTWATGIRTGRVDVADLSPLINSLKFYRPLRNDPGLFDSVHIVRNGRAVQWGDSAIDMSAASIAQLAEETMTVDDLAAFLKRHSFTQEAAAAALGYSKRQIINYLKGTSEIPRVFALACIGFESRHLKPVAPRIPEWANTPFGYAVEHAIIPNVGQDHAWRVQAPVSS